MAGWSGAVKRKVKLALDACMTLLMVLEMAYLATGSAFHEWAGMALFGLFIAHHWLNGAWHRRVLKGKYTLTRFVITALDIALTLMMLLEFVTGVLISEELFPSVGLNAGMEPRQLHTFAAYWGLLVMGAHLGLHWGMVMSSLHGKRRPGSKTRAYCARIAALALVALGVLAFVRLEAGAKLTMYYTFSYLDPDSSVLLYLFDFLFLLGGMAVLGYYGMKCGKYLQTVTRKE